MRVAVLTIGDELLAGDTTNTNATWLAQRLTERGVTVRRILTVPDEHSLIRSRVREYSGNFDAVIVTGGIGSTPDDVTVDAVADAFDRNLVISEQARADVIETLEALSDTVPNIDVDIDAEATIPEDARPLLNTEGLAPGCVVENVYVLPGIPSELKTMFNKIAEEFTGEAVSSVLYTVKPEANIVSALKTVGEEFDVTIGCYPDRNAGHNRIKVTATDGETLTSAITWLQNQIDASDTPVERDWGENVESD
ncbi:competence/damage-inducible protein A [Haloquadratum walsbyi]|jgi:molybdenum cofactor synthesis domain-containing protein|uniref:competence/damage-inducible protein A n=1 Tax=Haloquadratum walsbyi TaxID=293091 RepID=UPI0015F49947|nr:molybdopterin-binding protein [Haloquadratum walsbyi]